MGFIEMCGAVQTAQTLTQTQITIEHIVVSVGVGVDVGVGQCERTIKLKVVGQEGSYCTYCFSLSCRTSKIAVVQYDRILRVLYERFFNVFQCTKKSTY